jgi:hypothetical protein
MLPPPIGIVRLGVRQAGEGCLLGVDNVGVLAGVAVGAGPLGVRDEVSTPDELADARLIAAAEDLAARVLEEACLVALGTQTDHTEQPDVVRDLAVLHEVAG